MSKPEISILVVTYNNEKQVQPLIRSLLASKIIKQCEILIWDNDSKDHTAHELVLYKTRVRYHLSRINLGFAKAVNRLIKQARGERILLLNPDCIVRPTALQRMLEYSRAFDDQIVTCPRLVGTDGRPQASAFRFPTIVNAIRKYFGRDKRAYGKYLPRQGETVVEVAVMACMLIPKKIIERVGLLDERFFLYYEDIEFCRRLKRCGYPVHYLPTAIVRHEHGASGKSSVGEVSSLLLRSSYIYHGRIYAQLLHLALRVGQIWQKRILRKPL